MKRPTKDIVEIFGHAPNDVTPKCRKFWLLGGCPFTNSRCKKNNHDKTLTYGTCSVTAPGGTCIVCPNRFYGNNFSTLQRISDDAFGSDIPFFNYSEFLSRDKLSPEYVVALGMDSGKEIQIGHRGKMSMDWVLVHVKDGVLQDYTGVEVQSIDITGNYRDTWHAYKNIKTTHVIPSSGHGLNWANVHKRLIPQLIRKGQVYSRSALVKSGIYFIVPEIVFQKFEQILGSDIPPASEKAPNVMTVYTYAVGSETKPGSIRELVQVRQLRFTLENFIDRFVGGANLPPPEELDNAIRRALGLG